MQEFLLTLGDGSVVQLTGKVLHSRREPDGPDGQPAFVSGIQFIEDEPQDAAIVEDVIDKVR